MNEYTTQLRPPYTCPAESTGAGKEAYIRLPQASRHHQYPPRVPSKVLFDASHMSEAGNSARYGKARNLSMRRN